MTNIKFAAILVTLLMLTACVPTMSGYKPMNNAFIQSPDLKIVAEDGSFTIETGSSTPPFQSNIAASYDPNLAVNHIDSLIISRYDDALAIGAKKVLVHHTKGVKPLYGVLLLNPKPEQASGLEARSYSIRVPANYIYSSTGGNISVVYEAATIKSSTLRAYTWVLWLSDIEF